MIVAVVMAAAVMNAAAARAQGGSSTADKAFRFIANTFLGVGGYYFTDGSAMQALGNPKFGGSTTFYVRDAHRYGMLVTGGVEIAGAGDHWGPFGGGNSFSLTGASFQVSAERKMLRLAPFFSAGVFEGHIHSNRLGISKDQIVPSAVVGARFKFHRYAHLTARYRIAGAIGGIRTDGFSLGVSFFGE
jgi:hypothetical protein